MQNILWFAPFLIWGQLADAAASDPGPRSESLLDTSDGSDWPAYGRSYGEQHFSPLEQINRSNVSRLGLSWYFDLPAGNSVSGPIEVDGVIYTSTGYSIVRALDALTGNVLWTYNPHAPEQAGRKMRLSWGSRGLAWWNGKIYVGTVDGRLIAIDAKDGKEVWSVLTVGKDDMRVITGAPRVFSGKVIIGNGGADSAPIRGYVSTYDAETGKMLWRFYTVPGNPAEGFEDDTQAMAAKTWAGEWWKYGGGGTDWNTFTYDHETNSVFLGTGNGAPWNHRIRSAGKGDNLFLCSIVALDADTGKYKWHYQVNPGETWDYNASMDMQLATLAIGGRARKVVVQAPKNGFLYVLDRETGELLSANAIANKITWATGIDMRTGRPLENPNARYPNRSSFELWPGPYGAHTWLPSALNPNTGTLYLPVAESGVSYSDAGVDYKSFAFSPSNQVRVGVNAAFIAQAGSSLLAWDTVAQRPKWRISAPGIWNGGVMATASNLVFQGQATGSFSAYDGDTGFALWSFRAGAPVLAPPISYQAHGQQFVTVLTGVSTTAGIFSQMAPERVRYRTQARRILAFALDAKTQLPQVEPIHVEIPIDESFKPNTARQARGATTYTSACIYCHGMVGQSGGTAPELAESLIPREAAQFDLIVRKGLLVSAGMPRFEELSDRDAEDVRQYIRSIAVKANEARPKAETNH